MKNGANSQINKLESKSQDFDSESSFEISISQLEKALTINIFDEEINIDLDILSPPKMKKVDSINTLVPPDIYQKSKSFDAKFTFSGLHQALNQKGNTNTKEIEKTDVGIQYE